MKTRRRRTIGAALFCLLLVASSAKATEASSADVADLARRAADDPAALEQLRNIDVVDGQEMNLGTALDTDDEAALQARLETLARLTAATTPQGLDAAAAAAAAGRILESRRYGVSQDASSESSEPDGEKPSGEGWLQRAAHAVGDFFSSILHSQLVAMLALLAFAATVISIVYLLAGRRSGAPGRGRPTSKSGSAPGARDPGRLELLAAEAEAEGHYGEAVRLRFGAGLLRLDAAGRIQLQPWSTGRQVAARLSSEPFDRILATFEPVVYGHRIAVDEDAASSRRDWAHVLAKRQ